MRFDDLDALVFALDELRRGRAFVDGSTGHEVFAPCELELVHPDGGEPLVLTGTVVMPKEVQEAQGGVGLSLDAVDPDGLAAFAAPRSSEPEERAASPALRLKELGLTEQLRLARSSASLQERTLLERMLGKAAWEALLRNPRITVPEVARIARKGTVPRPLIELIVDNATWARAAPVRRALLANRKLGADAIGKVLRLTPRHELQLMAKQGAYPAAVRTAARRLLAGGG